MGLHEAFGVGGTGESVFWAAIGFGEKEAIVAGAEASRAKATDRPGLTVRIVDFLMKTHLYCKQAPHPFLPGFREDKMMPALYSFSEFGRWALYGSLEDGVRLPPSGRPSTARRPTPR